jgi:vacuolar-type H+-ATPase subunit E/Vma4
MTEFQTDEVSDRPRLEAVFETSGQANETDLSRRIASILDSAEAEAERIRERAQTEAASIVRAAHASAAERIDELTREPERIKDEAARRAHELVRNAEADASRAISEADQQARETIHQSEQHADTQRRETERAVAEMEAAMEQRKRQLKDEIRSLAELRGQASGSVAQVVGALEGAASELNRKLGAIPNVSAEAEPAAPVDLNAKSTFRRLRG